MEKTIRTISVNLYPPNNSDDVSISVSMSFKTDKVSLLEIENEANEKIHQIILSNGLKVSSMSVALGSKEVFLI